MITPTTTRPSGQTGPLQGQLASTAPDADPTHVTGRYAYAADGTRLIRQTRPGASNPNTATTLYFPGGFELTHISNSATGAWTTRSLRSFSTPGGTLLATQQATQSFNPATGATSHSTTGYTWLLSDAQRSVRYAQQQTSTSGGTRFHYYPFGDPLGTATQPATPGARGYLNKPHDPNGDIRLEQRNYSPTLNQLTTPDPLLMPGDPQSFNPYSYSRNNPILLVDPSGLGPVTCQQDHEACDNGDDGDNGGQRHPTHHGNATAALLDNDSTNDAQQSISGSDPLYVVQAQQTKLPSVEWLYTYTVSLISGGTDKGDLILAAETLSETFGDTVKIWIGKELARVQQYKHRLPVGWAEKAGFLPKALSRAGTILAALGAAWTLYDRLQNHGEEPDQAIANTILITVAEVSGAAIAGGACVALTGPEPLCLIAGGAGSFAGGSIAEWYIDKTGGVDPSEWVDGFKESLVDFATHGRFHY